MTLQNDFNVCPWLHVRNNLLIRHSKHLVMVMPMLALILAVVKWFLVFLELSGSWWWCMYSILTKCEDVILLLLFPSFAFLFILVPYIFWVLSFSHSPEFFAFMASSLHSLAGPWKFLLVCPEVGPKKKVVYEMYPNIFGFFFQSDWLLWILRSGCVRWSINKSHICFW